MSPLWLLRAAWLVLPLTVGAALTHALDGHSDPVRIAGLTVAWVLWAVGLVAALVPHPVALTVLRCLAAAAHQVAVVAAIDGAAPWVAIPWAGLVAVLALLPTIGVAFVNGPAYANERRFPLAPPGVLLLGPIELAWALLVTLPVVGVLLLAARAWLLGALACAVAVAAGIVLGRALHQLSCRWAVFVPAGFVLHDPMSLAEPVLFRREVIASLGPAPADSDGLDITQRSLGLAVELVLTEPVAPLEATRLLFTPTRPGRLLSEARRRSLAAAQD